LTALSGSCSDKSDSMFKTLQKKNLSTVNEVTHIISAYTTVDGITEMITFIQFY